MNSTEPGNDEIDLFDLLKVVWRWKLFIVGFVFTGLVIGGVVYYRSPVLYKSTASIRIGKIADIPVEKFEDLNLNLLLLSTTADSADITPIHNMDNNIIKAASLLTVTQDKRTGSLIILTSEGKSFNEAVQSVELIRNYIIERHRSVYNESVRNFNRLKLDSDINNKVKFEYLITSYNYPTVAVGGISTLQKKSGIEIPMTGDIKWPLFNRSLIKYLIIISIGLTFAGIFTIFLLDYVLTEIRKSRTS